MRRQAGPAACRAVGRPGPKRSVASPVISSSSSGTSGSDRSVVPSRRAATEPFTGSASIQAWGTQDRWPGASSRSLRTGRKSFGPRSRTGQTNGSGCSPRTSSSEVPARNRHRWVDSLIVESSSRAPVKAVPVSGMPGRLPAPITSDKGFPQDAHGARVAPAGPAETLPTGAEALAGSAASRGGTSRPPAAGPRPSPRTRPGWRCVRRGPRPSHAWTRRSRPPPPTPCASRRWTTPCLRRVR